MHLLMLVVLVYTGYMVASLNLLCFHCDISLFSPFLSSVVIDLFLSCSGTFLNKGTLKHVKLGKQLRVAYIC